MPITPTTSISATTMAANWGPGVQANANKWLDKYLHPKAIFNANPTQWAQNYETGVQDAITSGRAQANFAAADPNQAATNAQQFGINNYRASGTQKAYKYQAVASALAAALTTVRQQVDAIPRGPRGSQANQQRMITQMQGMAAYRGKIK